MSKTFDEGGAKGLLLANLGVGSSGCNIIFDSTLDNEDVTAKRNDDVRGCDKAELKQNLDDAQPAMNATSTSNSPVDVTSLIGKLESLLSNTPGNMAIENMPLVPQLASLRSQYSDLGKDGFVEEVGISVRI
jgi:condensin complex subunit 2